MEKLGLVLLFLFSAGSSFAQTLPAREAEEFPEIVSYLQSSIVQEIKNDVENDYSVNCEKVVNYSTTELPETGIRLSVTLRCDGVETQKNKFAIQLKIISNLNNKVVRLKKYKVKVL